MSIRFLPLTLALIAMWLALNETFALGHLLLGALAAAMAVFGLARLTPSPARLRRPAAAIALAGEVLLDIVRSNIAVAAIVLRRGIRGRTSGFVRIELDIRHPGALAALACIVTATPGTAWAGYDSRSNVLSMHVLDLVDEATWVRTIKGRYEARLREIFE